MILQAVYFKKKERECMLEVDSMYVDYNIPVCDSLPNIVKEEIAILDKAYKEDDIGTYMLHEDSVDTYLKSCVETRFISEAEYFQMCRRFGWR